MRGRKGSYRVLVKKLEGKRQPGIPARRWKYNIKKELQEVIWGHVLD